MNRWIFTFGCGYDLHDAYVAVEAETFEEARSHFMMTREAAGLDPRCWAFQYPESELAQMPWLEREVPIDTPAVYRYGTRP